MVLHYMQVSKTFRNAPDAQGVIMVNYRLMTPYTGRPSEQCQNVGNIYNFFSKLSFLTDKMYIITDRLPMFIIDLALALTFIKRICFMWYSTITHGLISFWKIRFIDSEKERIQRRGMKPWSNICYLLLLDFHLFQENRQSLYQMTAVAHFHIVIYSRPSWGKSS